MKVYLNPVDGRKSFYRKASMEMMEEIGRASCRERV